MRISHRDDREVQLTPVGAPPALLLHDDFGDEIRLSISDALRLLPALQQRVGELYAAGQVERLDRIGSSLACPHCGVVHEPDTASLVELDLGLRRNDLSVTSYGAIQDREAERDFHHLALICGSCGQAVALPAGETIEY